MRTSHNDCKFSTNKKSLSNETKAIFLVSLRYVSQCTFCPHITDPRNLLKKRNETKRKHTGNEKSPQSAKITNELSQKVLFLTKKNHEKKDSKKLKKM